MGFGLVANVTFDAAEIAAGCDKAFDTWAAGAVSHGISLGDGHQQAAMRALWRESWLSAIAWFAVHAAEQAEDALQRALARECTGGNA